MDIYQDNKIEHNSIIKKFEKCIDKNMKYMGTTKQGEYCLKIGHECQTCGYFILTVVELDKDLKIKSIQEYK
jgi:hypothetical protein